MVSFIKDMLKLEYWASFIYYDGYILYILIISIYLFVLLVNKIVFFLFKIPKAAYSGSKVSLFVTVISLGMFILESFFSQLFITVLFYIGDYQYRYMLVEKLYANMCIYLF